MVAIRSSAMEAATRRGATRAGYDTMSGVYAEFVEKEVLPLVEAQAHVNSRKIRRAGDDGQFGSGRAP